MIRLQQINKSYEVGGHPLHVLKDLDLTIAEGDMVAIMGSSGSGKSTLLNINITGNLIKLVSDRPNSAYVG